MKNEQEEMVNAIDGGVEAEPLSEDEMEGDLRERWEMHWLGDAETSGKPDEAVVGTGGASGASLETAEAGKEKMTADAYWRVYEEYGRAHTIGRLMRRGLNKEDAEDLAQAGWFKGSRYLNQLRDKKAVTRWVAMIAGSMIRREVASRNPLVQLEPKHGGKIDPAVDVRSVDLRRALYSSDSRQFQMLRRVSLDEWSIADVAKEVGKSETAVTSELARARTKLRKMMIPAKPPKSVSGHSIAA